MGASSSKKSPVIGSVATPMYCLNVMGSRHLLLGGGGGQAKTGVKNEIQTMLLGYDTNISHASGPAKAAAEPTGPRLRGAGLIDTSSRSTMGMDVISFGLPEDGRYLIAASHDQFCGFYETDGFEVVESDDEPRTLTLIPRRVALFETVLTANAKNDRFQKRVKFANLQGKLILVTSGSDGMIKVWNVEDILQDTDKSTPSKEWDAGHGQIDDLDVSPDGTTIFSLGDKSKSVFVWDTVSGRQLYEVQSPPGYTPRCVRFTNRAQDNNRDNMFFVVAYNPTVLRGKQETKLLRWVCSRRQTALDLVCSTNSISERISKIDVQDGGRWIAIGTMEGSVAVHRTSDLKKMKVNVGTHDNFVTDVKVLPPKTEDFPDLQKTFKMSYIPGPHSEAEVAVVSISVDNTVQLHTLPFDHTPSLVFVLLLSLLFTILCPVFFSFFLKL
uniref:WD_REPEATS_REGION domain-containing protein n=1 Tax=Steinernema glaseri TaxID=37863 RepID=A0A1I7YBH6_9BILA